MAIQMYRNGETAHEAILVEGSCCIVAAAWNQLFEIKHPLKCSRLSFELYDRGVNLPSSSAFQFNCVCCQFITRPSDERNRHLQVVSSFLVEYVPLRLAVFPS